MTLSVEQKVGLFFLLTLVALAIMIDVVEEWAPFESKIAYHANFKSVVGLNLGDPVRIAGVQIGKVTSVQLEDSHVKVSFYVNDAGIVREDSVASVRRTNLLGGVFLGLEFGSAESPLLEPGSTVRGVEMADIDQVISNIDKNQERVLGELGGLIEESRDRLVAAAGHLESVTRKIDEGEGFLGQMVNDGELYEEVKSLVVSLGDLSGRLQRGEGSLGRLFTDAALYEDASAALADLRELTRRARDGEGTVGRLFSDDRLYVEAADALSNFRQITDKANRGQGSLGLLVNDDSLYFETRDLMSRINSIAAKIDEGEGTLGRLVNDDDIYRDTKTVLRKVEKAVDGLSDSGPISAVGTAVGTLF